MALPTYGTMSVDWENRVDFDLSGLLTRSANDVTLAGTITFYCTDSLTGLTPQFSILLHRLYNAAGAPRQMANQFFSTILTPSGLPMNSHRQAARL